MNPLILWSQDRNNIYITFEIKNFCNKNIDFYESSVRVIGKTGNEKNIDIKLDLSGTIIPKLSSWCIKKNQLECKLIKSKNIFWNKLTKIRHNNIRIDWSRWEFESESEEEEDLFYDFNNFRKQLPSELVETDFTELLGTPSRDIEDLDEDITGNEADVSESNGEIKN